MPPARIIHRTTAFLLITFIIAHFGVHLTALWGPDAHISTLDFVQQAYRHPLGETILVLAILTQIVTGARRLRFGGTSGWATVQVVSGCYLLVFLFLHAGAALYTHNIYGLETNFYWSAGSLNFAPIKYFFAPYYFGAILAVFAHLAAALHFSGPNVPQYALRSLVGAGAIVAALIVTAFAGAFYDIEIPSDVGAYYADLYGVEPGENQSSN